jgi:hypothetical protein
MADRISSQVTESNVRSLSFKNQWLVLSVYFPQFMYKTKKRLSKQKFCRWLVPDVARLRDNDQPLGGSARNTRWLANGNEYQTTFVQVDKHDLVNMLRQFPARRGYSSTELTTPLRGTYPSNPPVAGSSKDVAGGKYFYRGLGPADVLRALVDWVLL